jgi:hypothetical protein
MENQEQIRNDRDPMESQLIKSLRYCKGITSNSMMSFIVPKYDDIEAVCSNIEAIYSAVKRDQEALLAYGKTNSEADEEKYDKDRADYTYVLKICRESINFIKQIKFQDYDKDIMGLIVYYGYIDDGTNSGLYSAKKAFHTFPCPIEPPFELRGPFEIKFCQRFDLSILNANKWFTDEFDLIK